MKKLQLRKLIAIFGLILGAGSLTVGFALRSDNTTISQSQSGNNKVVKLTVKNPYSFQTPLKAQYGNTYGVKNLFDGNRNTAWAFDLNHVKYECDQLFAFRCNVNARKIHSVKIWNGYCKNAQTFYNNTRPAYIQIYRGITDYPESKDIIYEGRLADTMNPQTLPVNPKFDNSKPTKIINVNLGFEPDGFYRGHKYNDVVISEIEFLGIPN